MKNEKYEYSKVEESVVIKSSRPTIMNIINNFDKLDNSDIIYSRVNKSSDCIDEIGDRYSFYQKSVDFFCYCTDRDDGGQYPAEPSFSGGSGPWFSPALAAESLADFVVRFRLPVAASQYKAIPRQSAWCWRR